MSLETSLRYLHTFHPASGVLLIGSGSGSLAPLISSLHVKEVILAEADSEQIKRMQKVHTLPQEWKIVNAIVYKDTPSCEYHYTNNTSANGIVPVDVLKPIFPNLTLKSFELSNAISISTLLEQTKATQVNWLLVDCYTQMPFFEENQAVLESFDVIVVRLLKDEKQTLDAWMTEQGFRSVEAYEESNPQVLMVVYLKDFSGRLELSHKLHKETNQKLQNELESLQAKEAQTRESKKILESKLSQLQETHTQATQGLDALQVKLSESEAKNKELVETKESLVQQLSELNQRAEALKTERDSARKERDECKTVHNELKINFEQKVKQLAERQERTNELQKKMQDTEAANENYKQRQTMLEDELKKAEMQIEIIKDLLLSGSR